MLFSCSFFKFSISFFKFSINFILASFSAFFWSYFFLSKSSSCINSFIFLRLSFEELFNLFFNSFISSFNLFKSSLNLFCKFSFSRAKASCIDLILSSYSCFNIFVELSELLFNKFIFCSYSFLISSIFFIYSSSFSFNFCSISSKRFLLDVDESIKSFFNLLIILFNCLISLFRLSIFCSKSFLLLFKLSFWSFRVFISSLNLFIVSSLFLSSLSPLFCNEAISFLRSIIIVFKLAILSSFSFIFDSNKIFF